MMKLMGWVIAAAAAFMAPNAMAAATETVEPTADTAAETAVAVDTGTEIEGAYMPLTPEPAVGIPDGRMGLQDQYTDIGQQGSNQISITCCGSTDQTVARPVSGIKL